MSGADQIERFAQAFCLASAREERANGSGEGPPAGVFGTWANGLGCRT
jgi:hypothetical protein